MIKDGVVHKHVRRAAKVQCPLGLLLLLMLNVAAQAAGGLSCKFSWLQRLINVLARHF
jgi:hypothetical protein